MHPNTAIFGLTLLAVAILILLMTYCIAGGATAGLGIVLYAAIGALAGLLRRINAAADPAADPAAGDEPE